MIEPVELQVIFTDNKLIVHLADGRSIVVPSAWYPRLLHGSSEEQQNWQLLGDGYAIEWPDLDEHIGIKGLLAERRSGESKKSLECWLMARMLRNPNINEQERMVAI